MDSLGDYLKQERERRGFSLEQVSNGTRIGLRILRAIECDQYADLPALPFLKGFIKSYSTYLGLSGERILERFGPFIEEKAQERASKEEGHKGYAFERTEGDPAKKFLWVTMTGLSVVGLLVFLVFKPSLKSRHREKLSRLPVIAASVQPSAPFSTSEMTIASSAPSTAPVLVKASTSPIVIAVKPSVIPSPPPVVRPSVAVVAVVASSSPSPKPLVSPKPMPSAAPRVVISPRPAAPIAAISTSPSAIPSAMPSTDSVDPLQSGLDYKSSEIRHKLVVRTLEDVWVRYRCDQKNPMRFALKKGKILVLRGKERVFFQSSNPRAVLVSGAGVSGSGVSLENRSGVFKYKGSSTLALPAGSETQIETEFKVDGILPQTPDPQPESPPSGAPNNAAQ